MSASSRSVLHKVGAGARSLTRFGSFVVLAAVISSGWVEPVDAAGGASASSQVLAACETDGATLMTAMSAFKAENPGLLATARKLTSSANGGPYLNGWPDNPTLYTFSVVKGVLFVQGGNIGSPDIPYAGPHSCREVGV